MDHLSERTHFAAAHGPVPDSVLVNDSERSGLREVGGTVASAEGLVAPKHLGRPLAKHLQCGFVRVAYEATLEVQSIVHPHEQARP